MWNCGFQTESAPAFTTVKTCSCARGRMQTRSTCNVSAQKRGTSPEHVSLSAVARPPTLHVTRQNRHGDLAAVRPHTHTKRTPDEINLTAEQLSSIRKFANLQAGKQFNKWGMYRASLPIMWRRTDGHLANGRWFCSELAVASLQAGGLCTSLNSATVSPNALYRACTVKNSGLRCSLTVNTHLMQQSRTSLQMFKQKNGECATAVKKP